MALIAGNVQPGYDGCFGSCEKVDAKFLPPQAVLEAGHMFAQGAKVLQGQPGAVRKLVASFAEPFRYSKQSIYQDRLGTSMLGIGTAERQEIRFLQGRMPSGCDRQRFRSWTWCCCDGCERNGRGFLGPVSTQSRDHFAKTGSGQTLGRLETRGVLRSQEELTVFANATGFPWPFGRSVPPPC